MKTYTHITLSIILFCVSSLAQSQDFNWGEDFQEGDVISASTFNQIFDSLEKINRTVTDADLVGTWTCTSTMTNTTNLAARNNCSSKGLMYMCTGSQITMTASSSAKSIDSAYSISTSANNPIFTDNDTSAYTGTYQLHNNTIYMSHRNNPSNTAYAFNVVVTDDNSFKLTRLSGNVFDSVMCTDSTPPPIAPTATAATNAQTAVNITWTDQSSDETGFKIYRRLSSQTTESQLATAITASPYVDSTLTEGQTAYYSVSSYNSNGESAHGHVVSATLDNTKPTVTSHTPTTSQQIDKTSTTISIIFSENVKIICPAGGDGLTCSTSGAAVNVVGTSSTYTCDDFKFLGRGLNTVLSSECTGNFNASDTITVTVEKEWIVDANGNFINADYSYSFTTGS